MRRAICAVLFAAAIAAGPSAAARSVTASATGEIANIGPARVHVGNLNCSIHAGAVSVAAAAFVIGDRVKVICRNQILTSIKYAPVTQGTGLDTNTSSARTNLGQSSTSQASRSSAPTSGADAPVCKTTVDAAGHDFTSCWILISG